MDRILSQARLFKRQGVTIVVLLLIVVAYFATVVPQKTQYFNDRYLRLLAGASDNLSQVVGNLGTALTNAVESGLSSTDEDSRRKLIEGALKLTPYFSLTEVTTNSPATTSAPAAATNEVFLSVNTNLPSPPLDLVFTDGARVWIRIHLSLAQLVEPCIHGGEFDDVLLLSAEGKVIYQLAPGSLRLAHLKIPQEGSFATNHVRLGGEDYHLFAQPVRVTSGASAGALELTLCGLVRADHFRTQTWAMDYTLLIGLCFAVVLLLVSWPLLNLWGGGLRNGLNVVETFLLGLSAMLVVALATLLVFNAYAYYGAREQVNQYLKVFATDVASNLGKELEQVKTQLSELDDLYGKASQAYRTDYTSIHNRTDLLGTDAPYRWLRMVFWTLPNGKQTNKWTIKQQNTSMINVAMRNYFRAIAEGRDWNGFGATQSNTFCLESIYSWNTGENLAIYAAASKALTNLVTAIDLRLLSLADPVVPDGYGYAVLDAEGRVLFHVDKQRNLRENFFIECRSAARLRAAVYGRTTNFVSTSYFQQPHQMYVTPLRDLPWSLVVFHNGIRLQLSQVEIVSVAGLLFAISIGALAAGACVALVISGRRAFRWLWPRSDTRGTYWLLSAIHFALAGLAVSVILVNHEPAFTFLASCGAPLGGVLLTWAGLRVGRPAPARQTTGRLMAWMEKIVARVRRSLNVSPRVQVPEGYIPAMALLLTLLGVVPTLGFLRIAFDHEVALATKQTQLKLAADLQARADRVKTEVIGATGLPGATHGSVKVVNPNSFVKQRLTNRLDLYEFNWNYTPTAAACTNCSTNQTGWFANLLYKVRPHYGELDVKPGGLWRDAASDGRWHWKATDREIELHTGTMTITAKRVHWIWPGVWWGLVFVALLAVPLCIVGFVALAMFGSRKTNQPVEGEQLRLGKYLVIGPPHAGKSAWLATKKFEAFAVGTHLDLRKEPCRKSLLPASLDEFFKNTAKPIIVDHFEYDLANAKFNRRKFQFLQQFATDGQRPIIVLSNVHPLHFPLSGGGESNALKLALARLKEQRMELLAAYQKIHKPDDAVAQATEGDTVHQKRAHYRSLWVTCSPREQEILHQVALGRLVSAGQEEVRSLVERKLLKSDPGLHLGMEEEEFSRFIQFNHRPEPGATPEAASAWQTIKGPAMTAIIIAAAFLYITQRAVWDYTIGLVPAILGGIVAFGQIVNLVRPGKGGEKPP